MTSTLSGPAVAAPRPVVVRFGETADGYWQARLGDGSTLRCTWLGDLLDEVHEVLHVRFGRRVRYELRHVPLAATGDAITPPASGDGRDR